MFNVIWSTIVRNHSICTSDGYTVQDLYSTYKNCNFHVYYNGIELDPENGLMTKI
jgi:hypothetical protein